MIGMISAHSRICRWMSASHASPPCSSLRSIHTSMPVSRNASQTAKATAMSSLVYDKKTALGDELESASDIGVSDGVFRWHDPWASNEHRRRGEAGKSQTPKN